MKSKRTNEPDYFDRQESARKRTRLFIFLYYLAALALGVLFWFMLVVGATLCHWALAIVDGNATWKTWEFLVEILSNPYGYIGAPTLFVFVVIACSAYLSWKFKYIGVDGLATGEGGTRIDRSTTNLDERRFYKLVEEMALKYGCSIPAVYVMRDEYGINAFARGYDWETSSILATAGAVQGLNYDELRGVVAHEFAHLVNGDCKMDMRLASLVFAPMVLTWGAIFILGWTNVKGGRYFGGVGAVALFYFGSIVLAAFRRRQELAADEKAVEFTQNRQALADALKKLGGLSEARDKSRESWWATALEMWQKPTFSLEKKRFFFSAAFWGDEWYFCRTHPSLKKRIKILDPDFSGNFPKVVVAPKTERAERRFHDVAAIRKFLQIPTELEALLKDFDGARAVLFALLLDSVEKIRRPQLETIRALEGEKADVFLPRVEEAERWLSCLTFSTRAAVACLAVPTLKRGTVDDYKRFRKTGFELCDADKRLDLFEFALQTSLIRELDVWYGLKPAPTARWNFERVAKSFQTTLTYLAFRGADEDEEAARRAFEAGVSALGDVVKKQKKITPPSTIVGRSRRCRQRRLLGNGTKKQKRITPTAFEKCTIEIFYEATDELAQTKPRLKEKILKAFRACIEADGRVTEEETALFDAISLAIGVPAPLWRDVVDASEAAAKSAKNASVAASR